MGFFYTPFALFGPIGFIFGGWSEIQLHLYEMLLLSASVLAIGWPLACGDDSSSTYSFLDLFKFTVVIQRVY